VRDDGHDDVTIQVRTLKRFDYGSCWAAAARPTRDRLGAKRVAHRSSSTRPAARSPPTVCSELSHLAVHLVNGWSTNVLANTVAGWRRRRHCSL
jgi:hypothetical protein